MSTISVYTQKGTQTFKQHNSVQRNSSFPYVFQLAQLERAHSRLQCELEHHKDSNQAQEHHRESRLQVDQMQEQTARLSAELSSLQTAHDTLRLLTATNIRGSRTSVFETSASGSKSS